MEVKIKYEDILKRCEMLSSFESEGKADANGESRYLELHINKVDEQLIQQYIMQARGILEERMERMIENIEEYGGVIQFPSTTPVFEFDEELDSDKMGKYNVVNTGIPSDIYKISYLHTHRVFAVNNGHDTLYTNLADIEALGDDRYNYIEEANVKKVYRKKGSENELTWASLYNGGHTGAGLVDFERGMINQNVPGFTWSIRTTTRWNGIKTFTKHVHEAIVSYAMAAWLKGKLDDRVAFYEGLFNNTLAQAVKNLFTKQPPKK